jgi:2-haloacid dehalogenase
MPVSAVVFDVGNVLYHWSMRHLFAQLIPNETELDWFMANVVTDEWHFQHDAGRSLDDMVAERISEYPDYTALITAYATRFNETIPGPVAGMIEMVGEIAGRDVPIYGITNFGAELWAGFRPTAPVFDHFTDIVVSGVEKLVKPDPAIYALALKRFGLRSGEGIFIDDRLENIVSARDNGFIGHHFRDAGTLRLELERHGIL